MRIAYDAKLLCQNNQCSSPEEADVDVGDTTLEILFHVVIGEIGGIILLAES